MLSLEQILLRQETDGIGKVFEIERKEAAPFLNDSTIDSTKKPRQNYTMIKTK